MDTLPLQRRRGRRHAPLHAVVGRQPALDFPRGYHVEIGGGFGMPGAGFLGGIHKFRAKPQRPGDRAGGYGARSEERLPPLLRRGRGFSGRGEQVPNEQSYCEIDPVVVDRWGIPVLRFNFRGPTTSGSRRCTCRRPSAGSSSEMGGTPLSPMPGPEDGYGIAPGGRIIHEVGVTRMGHSPSTSVLNSHCQAHDVEESVRGRRRPVRDQRRQERDLDDPRAGHAHQRAHRRPA